MTPGEEFPYAHLVGVLERLVRHVQHVADEQRLMRAMIDVLGDRIASLPKPAAPVVAPIMGLRGTRRNLVQMVSTALTGHESMRCRHIADTLGLRDAEVHVVLTRLSNAGFVEQLGDKSWRLIRPVPVMVAAKKASA